MKGVADEPQYSVGLLEGGTALCDVIDSHIYEQTLVRNLTIRACKSVLEFVLNTCYCIVFQCLLYVVMLHIDRFCESLQCVSFSVTHSHVLFILPQSEKNAFFVADLGAIMRQHVRWRAHMAQIRPYYPVRCNSSPAVIEVLAALGTGFICTNKV